MKKVYRLLEWLDTRQAVDWLQDLTATHLTERELLQMCEAKQCDLYILASGLEGVWFDPDGNEQECTGSGYQKLLGRHVKPPLQHLQLEGQYWEHPIDEAYYPGEGYWEAATEVEAGYGIHFKPADIEALARKMNDIEQQASHVESLRDQLEQERSAREAAELELIELRQQRGVKALEDIRGFLHDDIEYHALLERAEAAERMVESMDKQLGEQAEKLRNDRVLLERMAARLDNKPKTEQQESGTACIVSSLVFPYATKHLEAMRDAAAKFWQGHDRTAPAPYGIQKKVQNFLIDRTGENARKAAELAAAIKPDDLPRT